MSDRDMVSGLTDFIRESNAIEGIRRKPTRAEIAAMTEFLASPLTLETVCALQAVFAPGRPIRDRVGMNVRVGAHIAPAGGKHIATKLRRVINSAAITRGDFVCWRTHVQFETLHPFMDGNGRTGRALWAWQMLRNGQDPFSLPFLHRFYYQTLAASEGRRKRA
jgi:hypothetical protein